jgi:hypothetical protein
VFTFVPVAVGVAVLRYRLFEIDRIISRTVSYALVTLVLVGIYAGLVLLPVSLSGGEETPDVVVAGATLVAAAVFRPLRSRVQRFVDRRFNRARYDAGRIVEDFGARLRDELDLAQLGDAVQGVVATTMQPSHVSMWLSTQRTRA